MDFKGSELERDIILWGVRWYVAYPISYRQLEMMQERGVEVDHSSPQSLGAEVHARLGPDLSATQAFGGHERAHGQDLHQRQGPVEIRVSAIDKAGRTIDFTSKRYL